MKNFMDEITPEPEIEDAGPVQKLGLVVGPRARTSEEFDRMISNDREEYRETVFEDEDIHGNITTEVVKSGNKK